METKSKIITRRLIISGRVQGVGYRAWCRRTCRKLGLGCEVQNQLDGNVKLALKGTKDKVDQMHSLCYSGPLLSKVKNITILNSSPKSTKMI